MLVLVLLMECAKVNLIPLLFHLVKVQHLLIPLNEAELVSLSNGGSQVFWSDEHNEGKLYSSVVDLASQTNRKKIFYSTRIYDMILSRAFGKSYPNPDHDPKWH
jgi:hypothetical protein